MSSAGRKICNPSKVCFITDDQSYYLFRDLCQVKYLKSYVFQTPKSRLFSYVQKLHTNKKLAQYISLPFQDVWYSYSDVLSFIDDGDIVLINSSAMTKPTLSFWIRLKKDRPRALFALVLVDSMHGHSAHMEETKRRMKLFPWDSILSYDPYDCKEYGFFYIGFHYCSRYDDVQASQFSSDLYYISSVKAGREEILRKIHKEAKSHGIKTRFRIYSLWRHIDYGECIRRVEPYEKVVADVKATNCILEILQDGQNAQSLRYLEALMYNKKLLTNNKNIKKLPYYNQRYIQYFNRVENIDWEWIKRREPVRYSIKEKFSSADLLQDLFSSIMHGEELK